MLFSYQKCINTLEICLKVRIFLKLVTEVRTNKNVFDEDIFMSETFSFRFVLCSLWLCSVDTIIRHYKAQLGLLYDVFRLIF